MEWHPKAKQVLEKLQSGLKSRFMNIEFSNTLGICTFMDPRFKNIVFDDYVAADTIKKKIIKLVTEIIFKNDSSTRKSQTETSADNGKNKNHNINFNCDNEDKFSLWKSYDIRVASHKPQGTASSRAIIEVQRYMETEILDRHADPLEWWSKHHYNYPYLKQIIQEKCCALATSVPCERLFSKAGNILSERRTRLNTNKINQLLMLNVNKEWK